MEFTVQELDDISIGLACYAQLIYEDMENAKVSTTEDYLKKEKRRIQDLAQRVRVEAHRQREQKGE